MKLRQALPALLVACTAAKGAFDDQVGYAALDVGGEFACARHTNGAVYCWGKPQGTAGAAPSPRAIQIPVGFDDAVEVAAGSNSACARSGGGDVVCWGNTLFESPLPGPVRSPTPLLQLPPDPVVQIEVTASHGCMLTMPGDVYCWGRNEYGCLGTDPTTTPSSAVPLYVSGLPAVTQISAGGNRTCALDRNGGVWCWGHNPDGELGNGSIGVGSVTPVPAQFPASVVIEEVIAGSMHTCARDTQGSLWCWGDDTSGQLGRGSTSTTPSLFPVKSSLVTGIVAVAAGQQRTCVRYDDGSAQCWGAGMGGELGDGNSSSSVIPVNVALTNIIALRTGFDSTCALRSGGDVWCWGRDNFGQIGDGTAPSANDRPTPTQVVGGP